jgi:hypothetical protein
LPVFSPTVLWLVATQCCCCCRPQSTRRLGPCAWFQAHPRRAARPTLGALRLPTIVFALACPGCLWKMWKRRTPPAPSASVFREEGVWRPPGGAQNHAQRERIAVMKPSYSELALPVLRAKIASPYRPFRPFRSNQVSRQIVSKNDAKSLRPRSFLQADDWLTLQLLT